MCSFVAVKEMNVIYVYEINHIRTVEMKSNEEWSLSFRTQLSNCVRSVKFFIYTKRNVGQINLQSLNRAKRREKARKRRRRRRLRFTAVSEQKSWS